ncbi:MAG: hypothetical protein ACRCTI_14155 [Beijerinckiaceae bacterium]
MGAALRAGAGYFALVFGLGFLLGSLRHGLMGFGLSRGLLVALEVPVILAFAWWAAGWCAARFAVPTSASARLAMGLAMLVLLQAGEAAVGVLMMGMTWQGYLGRMQSAGGRIELLPQVVAAAFPLLSARLTGR